MNEQDELEIETRLRAALQARSELVTHSTLRPGIPPNEHTAGVRARREAWWSWRRMWVPVTVAAALAGGVFVGAQLPSGSSGTSAASGTPTPSTTTSGPTGGATEPSKASTTPLQDSSAAGTPGNIGTLGFTVPAGWQIASVTATSVCVIPNGHAAPAAPGTKDTLPCGVDGLYLKSDATTTAWPLSTAAKDAGWWPTAVSSASDIVCPAAKPGSAADSGSGDADMVKASMLLRSSTKFALAGQNTADYHEWAVTCDSGPGVQPMLWKLNAAPGAAAPTTFAIATVVSSDPQYDTALLDMVGSLHQTS